MISIGTEIWYDNDENQEERMIYSTQLIFHDDVNDSESAAAQDFYHQSDDSEMICPINEGMLLYRWI